MSQTTTGVGLRARVRGRQVELLVAAVAVTALTRPWTTPLFQDPAVQTWATMFVAIVVQSLPFLVFGVLLAGLVSVVITDRALTRLLPRKTSTAVPVAGLAGFALPGCECASVPIAGSLVRRGVVPAAAFTFLLAAPAINPVVLVSTAVAFNGQPSMVLARFLASLATAVIVGWIWAARFGDFPLRLRSAPQGGTKFASYLSSVQHDILHAGGFLVLGGAVAATVNTLLPAWVLTTLAGNILVGVLTLAILAVVIAMCSEADAFIAASLTAFSDTAKLAFMVVGPAVDVKLAALQAGTFGSAFAVRFAPLTFVVAVLSALLTGWWLL